MVNFSISDDVYGILIPKSKIVVDFGHVYALMYFDNTHKSLVLLQRAISNNQLSFITLKREINFLNSLSIFLQRFIEKSNQSDIDLNRNIEWLHQQSIFLQRFIEKSNQSDIDLNRNISNVQNVDVNLFRNIVIPQSVNIDLIRKIVVSQNVDVLLYRKICDSSENTYLNFNLMLYGVIDEYANSITFDFKCYRVVMSSNVISNIVDVSELETKTTLNQFIRPIIMFLVKPVSNGNVTYDMIKNYIGGLAYYSTPVYPDRSNKGIKNI